MIWHSYLCSLRTLSEGGFREWRLLAQIVLLLSCNTYRRKYRVKVMVAKPKQNIFICKIPEVFSQTLLKTYFVLTEVKWWLLELLSLIFHLKEDPENHVWLISKHQHSSVVWQVRSDVCNFFHFNLNYYKCAFPPSCGIAFRWEWCFPFSVPGNYIKMVSWIIHWSGGNPKFLNTI